MNAILGFLMDNKRVGWRTALLIVAAGCIAAPEAVTALVGSAAAVKVIAAATLITSGLISSHGARDPAQTQPPAP